MSIFEQLKRNCISKIKHYQEDLTVHDRKWLDKWPKTSFLHFSGKYGTTMVPLPSIESFPKKGERVRYLLDYSTREHILDDKLILVKEMPKSGRTDAIQHFDAKLGILKTIDQEQAINICLNYIAEIKSQWSQ